MPRLSLLSVFVITLVLTVFFVGAAVGTQAQTCSPSSSNGGLNPQTLTESGVAAPAGFFWSEVQHDTGITSVSNAAAGFSAAQGLNRLADNFTITQPCTINSVAFYAYSTGSQATPSPFTAYTLQIWNGRPGDPGAVVVFGDTTTNRLATSVDTTYFRIFNTVVPPPGTAPGTTRKIWRNTVTVGTTLPAGTYWLDWASTVTGGASNFHPSKTIAGSRGAAGDNARQFTVAGATWADVVDTGNPATPPSVPQDFPFDVVGSGGGTPTATSTGTPQPTATFTSTATATATPTPAPTTGCTTTNFANPAGIAIPNVGTSLPYPSSIVVSGLSGSVSKATVKLNGLNHTFPTDIDVLLVGPGGQNAIIMSDVGGGSPVMAVSFTLDDDAAVAIPAGPPINGSTYRPTNVGAGDTFPAPAPAPAGGSALSTFVGTAPNGTWSLYVVDDTVVDLGSFAGGWELNITIGTCPPSTPTGTATATGTNTATPTATATPIGLVSLPNVNAVPATDITVPMTVNDTTGNGVVSYDLQITYDPAVVTPMTPPFDETGTVSSTMTITSSNDNPGHLLISAFQESPLTGSGTLLNLKFTVNGAPGLSTVLAFEDYTDPGNVFHPGFRFNEGTPDTSTIDGSVTIDVAGTVSGTIRYGNASTERFVSNVTVNGSGSPNVTTTTGAPGPTAGQYDLAVGFGPYTVTPTKTGDANGITSFDAAKVAAHVAGTAFLIGNAQVAADVSGNNSINSFDAAQIARFVVSSPPYGNAGKWTFFASASIPFPLPTPAPASSRTYSSVSGNIAGEDYIGILIGEVSGNWTNTGARQVAGGPLAEGSGQSENEDSYAASGTDLADKDAGIPVGPERGIAVELPAVSVEVGKEVVIPVNVQSISDKGMISYEFDLRYDPSVIQPQNNPVDLKDSVSRGLSVVTNAKEPGLLRVVVYGPLPIDKDGVLLNLRFTAVGKPGSVSPVSFERIMFNEGDVRLALTDGRVELF